MRSTDCQTRKPTETAPRAVKRAPRRRVRPLFVALVAALTILVVSLLVMVMLNDWHVALSVEDGTETVECPADYRATDVKATLTGRFFCRKGVSLPVRCEGSVNGGVPGRYELTYSASFLSYGASCTREILVVDTTPPEIILTPETRTDISPDLAYEDPGYQALDAVDGDLTDQIVRTASGDKITYTVTDKAGNTATAVRTIPYLDVVAPVITLAGEASITLRLGEDFADPGVFAQDDLDGDLSGTVSVTGDVDTSAPGTYVLTYTVADKAGNTSSVTRTVTVSGKVIYLTFDDGPSIYTSKLLDVLAKYDVKVTFFVVKGNNSDESLDILTREAQEGHTVAIHSYSHNYKKIYASEEAYFADLEAMSDIIYEKTGIRTTLVRFPGGSSNTVSRFNPGIMKRLAAALEEKGYHYFDWNISSGDADGKPRTSDDIYNNVVSACAKREVSVVLQHDIKSFSVDAVERIIQWGLANGYTFLPLTEDSPGAHHRINN